jgi:hypothetical protein
MPPCSIGLGVADADDATDTLGITPHPTHSPPYTTATHNAAQ